jgi:cytochrome c peroxidase
MKIILFLALIVSSYGYAQSGHDHASESSPKDNQHTMVWEIRMV